MKTGSGACGVKGVLGHFDWWEGGIFDNLFLVPWGEIAIVSGARRSFWMGMGVSFQPFSFSANGAADLMIF